MCKTTSVLICLIIASTSFQWSEQLEDGINNVNDILSKTVHDVNVRNKMIASLLGQLRNLSSLQALRPKLINAKEIDRPIPTTVLNCTKSLQYMSDNVMSMWVLQMLDSFAKPPSGILLGNIYWPGSFDECLRVKAPKSKEFPSGLKGRYCKIVPKAFAGLKYGLCVPNLCGGEELKHSYTRKAVRQIVSEYRKLKSKNPIEALSKILPVSSLDSALSMHDIVCVPLDEPLPIQTIACVTFLLVLFTILIMATVVDYKLSQPHKLEVKTLPYISTPDHIKFNSSKVHEDAFKEPSAVRHFSEKMSSTVKEVVRCFSIIKNTNFIFETSNKAGDLSCIHGIRTITMGWVILGHSINMGITQMDNMFDILFETLKMKFSFISSATFSVDTFFVMSGFLFSYIFLKEQTLEVTKWNICKLYVLRYIRLTPAYMMIIICFITLPPFFGPSLNWDLLEHQKELCYDKWWLNLLYISNYHKIGQECLAWGWYLSCDTQFFMIAPLFLIYLKSSNAYERKIGLVIALTMIFGSMFITSYECWTNSLLPSGFINDGRNITGMIFNFPQPLVKSEYYMDNVYIKPQHRIPPYIIGCLLGYVLLLVKQSRTILSRKQVLSGWTLCLLVLFLTINVVYFVDHGPIVNTLYNTFSRSLWAAGVSWIIFACLTDNGGPVNSFLSLKFWIPLSRLTYCAYLIHPILISLSVVNPSTPNHFSYGIMFREFFGYFALSYIFAFFLTLLFESPIIRLTKLYREPKVEMKNVELNGNGKIV